MCGNSQQQLAGAWFALQFNYVLSYAYGSIKFAFLDISKLGSLGKSIFSIEQCILGDERSQKH